LEAMLAVFERLGGMQARAIAERHWERPDAEAAEHYRRVCLPLYAREPLPPEVMGRALLRPEIAPRFYAGEEWRTFDLCAAAPAIRCPTLVVSGSDDPVAPHAVAQELVTGLPAGLGRLETVPRGRHVLFRDAPETVHALAMEFVRAWWTEHDEVAA
ncbi:MAG: alpha/beta hydrolase, partial [Conexibacter sp.]